MKAVNLEGPPRAQRREAVKDGMELGKKFLAEGEAGARSAARLTLAEQNPTHIIHIYL